MLLYRKNKMLSSVLLLESNQFPGDARLCRIKASHCWLFFYNSTSRLVISCSLFTCGIKNQRTPPWSLLRAETYEEVQFSIMSHIFIFSPLVGVFGSQRAGGIGGGSGWCGRGGPRTGGEHLWEHQAIHCTVFWFCAWAPAWVPRAWGTHKRVRAHKAVLLKVPQITWLTDWLCLRVHILPFNFRWWLKMRLMFISSTAWWWREEVVTLRTRVIPRTSTPLSSWEDCEWCKVPV